MKKLFDIKWFSFYCWVGLAFMVMGILSDIHPLRHHESVRGYSFNNLWAALYITLINYLLFEYTFPRLSRKKIPGSFLRIVLHIVLYSWGLYAWRNIGIGIGFYTSFAEYDSIAENLAERLGYGIESFFFFGIIRHLYNHVLLRQTAQQLRIEKQVAELSYLKAQTNPHFLFNTLNNIYSLARDKSDLAPESILRLSKILRYMLYETSGPYIAIEQELKITADYISLEKLRYDDSLRVNFNHDIDDRQQALPPLLLLPLVENAFKHGVSEARENPFINIRLSVNKRQLLFTVTNSIGETNVHGQVKENIGISNLRRQLELQYTDYNLSLEQNAFEFNATLKINLGSHV